MANETSEPEGLVQQPKSKHKPKEKPAKKLPTLSESELSELLSLSDSYARTPATSSAELVWRGHEALSLVQKHRAKLLKRSKLDKGTHSALKSRRDLLRKAEKVLEADRERSAPRATLELRKAARQLIDQSVAAIRYFSAESVVGVSGADSDSALIDDLKKCAVLIDQAGAALDRADLPKNASEKCRSTAVELSQVSQVGGVALPLHQTPIRNRAYWHLAELLMTIAAAGRYVFRDDPKRLVAFAALDA